MEELSPQKQTDIANKPIDTQNYFKASVIIFALYLINLPIAAFGFLRHLFLQIKGKNSSNKI